MTVLQQLRAVVAFLYCLAGIAGCVTFLILGNYAATIWAFISATTCFALLHLHILTIRKTLQAWYAKEELQSIARFGFGVFAIGTSALVYHLVIEIMEKLPILPVQQSQIIPAVWCLITLKSGLLLNYYAQYYKRDNYPDGSGILRGVDHDDQQQ